jgi:hypothetical protein
MTSPYAKEKWLVRIVGSDDIYEKGSFQEAVNASCQWNKWFSQRASEAHEYDPLCYAVIEPEPREATATPKLLTDEG